MNDVPPTRPNGSSVPVAPASAPQPGHTDPALIRNFCVIAHIDHGKSTLADRMLQLTGVVEERAMRAQYLDRMDIERERGITIKSQAVRLPWQATAGAGTGETYILNLIDTPGHVDFTYEVSRSLAACEGAVLLVDAAQGIEAQTLANLYLALDADLHIIPVLNKIDLPSAQPDKYAAELAHIIGCDVSDVLRVSAKTGEGVEHLLNEIVAQVPAPQGEADAPARALIFDSVYDTYRGVVTYIRVVDGAIGNRQRVLMMSTKASHETLEVGVISPEPTRSESISVGEVGYIMTGVKEVRQSRVGDTVTLAGNRAETPLAGYRHPNPMVYAGLYPVDGDDYPDLRDALDKLQLNDAALLYEPETSGALGFGFRCGFLGLLHMEIVRERLEREFNLDLISTAPNVVYRVVMEDGGEVVVTNPSEFPGGTGAPVQQSGMPKGKIAEVHEPVVRATILTPADFIGAVMELCQSRRGQLQGMDYLSTDRVEMRYTLPLAEIVFDFFDALKSRTRGYASLDYEPTGEQAADLVKVDILLHGDTVDAFSAIVHKDKAYSYGVSMAQKLKELIPRQQFEVPIQAAIGSRIIARESIRAIRKDVLAKCYGGDITRKRKLLEKQKEGKKRMKMVGRVEVPQEAFVAALSTTDSGPGQGAGKK
ncbi:translation elongation factor 4 [Actinopolymorpha alba]|uniref:translation elongation factor 4 n=1 Tax=Actinopolymorpha alba TaxID=533267 RepID=UPI0012F6595E